MQSLASHYSQVLKSLTARISRFNKGAISQAVKREKSSERKAANLFRRAIRLLRRSSDAWVYDAKRMKSLGLDIKYLPDSLEKMRFEDEFFDRVFSISVMEHLPEHIAYAGMREMTRVLKKRGLLVVTVDNDGPHVTPALRGKYRELIAPTGLSLSENLISLYRTLVKCRVHTMFIGFVLQK